MAKLDEFPANSAGAAPTKKITMSGIADFLHSNYYTNLDSTYSVAGSYGETYKTLHIITGNVLYTGGNIIRLDSGTGMFQKLMGGSFTTNSAISISSIILGGATNTGRSNYNFIGNGTGNYVTGNFALIVGGHSNKIYLDSFNAPIVGGA